MQPLVSILIPCYNAERFVRDAVQSALAQTWPRLEVIVVDDGSADDSVEMVASLRNPRVRLIKQRNSGAAAARNSALRHAKGEFIQYLDSDDLLSADKVAAQLALLERSPRGCVAVAATRYFADGTDPENGLLQDGWPLVHSDDPLEWLIQLHGGDARGLGGMVQTASWLVPREVSDAAGLWDETPSPDDDGEYFARVVLASAGIRRSSDGCVYYRKHVMAGSSLSRRNAKRYQSGALHSLDSRAELILAQRGTGHAKLALARCYRQRAFLAYPFARDVSRRALERARELGDHRSPAEFGTWKGRFLAALLGWRAVRTLNVAYHCIRRKVRRA